MGCTHSHDQQGHDNAAHAEHGDSADAATGGAGGPDPNDPQDMRNMGGLWGRLKITAPTMLIATLAIAGVGPFAGFWSKDEILWRTWNAQPGGIYGWLFWGVGALTALITAFYMFRLVMKTFFGTPRTEAAKNAPESSFSMTLPLIVLAILSTITGWAVLSFKTFSDYLAPSLGETPEINNPDMENILKWGILAFIVLMIGYAIMRYRGAKDGLLLSPQQRAGFLPRLVANKYFVDEAYNFWFVALGKRFSDWLWRTFDKEGVDGIVNGVGQVISGGGRSLRVWQNGYVRSYAFSIVGGIILILAICVGRSLNW